MKIDVNNLKARHENWKVRALEFGESGLTKANSDILIKHVIDMEQGFNVAKGSKKGGRSYPRLYNIRQRLSQIFKMLEERGVKDVTKIKDNQIQNLFSDMERGVILTSKGEKYMSVADYVKVFKAFWHWYMKVNRKEGKSVMDITEDLNTSYNETKFVYFTKDDLDKMLPYLNKKEQTILAFAFDSIIRCPTEILSLKVKDIYEEDGDVWVNVPQEISKIRGRSFNLLFSGKAILEHIKENNLKPNDQLFDFSSPYMNWKLQKIAEQIWGDKISHPKAGELYKKITLYDARHSGTIHLRLLAKDNPSDVSLDAIRERGGWTDFKMLNYYSRFIGLDGKINKQGLMIKKDKHELEIQVDNLKKQMQMFQEIFISKFEELEREGNQDKMIKFAKSFEKEISKLPKKAN